MARLIILGALLSVLGSCRQTAISPPSPSDDERVVREVTERFAELVAAAKSLDSGLYLSFVDATRFSGLRADGVVYHSRDSFRSDYVGQVASIKEYISLGFSRVKVTALGPNTAVLVNEYQARVRLRDGSLVDGAGGGAQVWSKDTGRWLLVSVSSSVKNTD